MVLRISIVMTSQFQNKQKLSRHHDSENIDDIKNGLQDGGRLAKVPFEQFICKDTEIFYTIDLIVFRLRLYENLLEMMPCVRYVSLKISYVSDSVDFAL